MKRARIIIVFLLIILVFSIRMSNDATYTFNDQNFIESDVPESSSEENETTEDTPQKLVFIDAGHGGVDPGAESSQLAEKDIALDVCLKLDKILKESGIKTYMSRADDSTVKINSRIQMANDLGAALFLSVHCDSFTDPAYSGTATLYYTAKAHDTGKLSSMDYAQTIQDSLIEAIHTEDRGIAKRTDLGVLKYTNMPSVLVELAFLTNPSDESLLGQDDFRQKAAEGLADGIKEALGNT